MRYMFLIYSQETDESLSPEEIDQVVRGHRVVMADAGQKGILLGVERLKPTRTATTIRMSDGRPMTIDGPFAETKEQLAGYYILECKDLDEAIEWASKIPTTCGGALGCVEVRAIREMPEAVKMLLEAEYAKS